MTMKEVTLPTGAVLKIQLAPFAEAKALYKAVLRELKELKLEFSGDSKRQLESYIMEGFCGLLSSDEVEASVHQCMGRCLYNGQRIAKVDETFESAEAREDYSKAIIEVAKENLTPFSKALFAEFKGVAATIGATRQPT